MELLPDTLIVPLTTANLCRIFNCAMLGMGNAILASSKTKKTCDSTKIDFKYILNIFFVAGRSDLLSELLPDKLIVALTTGTLRTARDALARLKVRF